VVDLNLEALEVGQVDGLQRLGSTMTRTQIVGSKTDAVIAWYRAR